MRPRKVILWICDQEERRRIIRFTLECYGFRVYSGGRLPRKQSIIARADAALVDHAKAKEICASIRLLASEATIVNIGMHDGGAAHIQLPPNQAETVRLGQLIETMRTAALRKRGPKKRELAPVELVAGKQANALEVTA